MSYDNWKTEDDYHEGDCDCLRCARLRAEERGYGEDDEKIMLQDAREGR